MKHIKLFEEFSSGDQMKLENEIAEIVNNEALTMTPQLFAANFGVTFEQLRSENKRNSTIGIAKLNGMIDDFIEYDNGRKTDWATATKYKINTKGKSGYHDRLDKAIRQTFKKMYRDWEEENWKNYCNNRQVFQIAMKYWARDENIGQLSGLVDMSTSEKLKLLKRFSEKQPRAPFKVHKSVIMSNIEDSGVKYLFETYKQIKEDMSDSIDLVKQWVFSGLSLDDFAEQKKGRISAKKFGF
jgi:hypothetical protein